jgi:large conductance mechanosensitive channel
MTGFAEFLQKSNALALAIGVIIGAALGSVVDSLVNDIIMPPIGWALGGIDFASIQTVLGTNTAADGTTTEVVIGWGLFINSLIVFVVVALVVYLMAKALIREPAPEPTVACPSCLEPNRIGASRCRACTGSMST